MPKTRKTTKRPKDVATTTGHTGKPSATAGRRPLSTMSTGVPLMPGKP